MTGRLCSGIFKSTHLEATYLDNIHANEDAGVDLTNLVQLSCLVLLGIGSQVVFHCTSQLWIELHRFDLRPGLLPRHPFRAGDVVLIELAAVQLLVVGLHSLVWPHFYLEMGTRAAEVLNQLPNRLAICPTGSWKIANNHLVLTHKIPFCSSSCTSKGTGWHSA